MFYSHFGPLYVDYHRSEPVAAAINSYAIDKLPTSRQLQMQRCLITETQLKSCCSPDVMNDLAARVTACTDDVLSWMRSNRLELNTDKTELIWCATSRRLHRFQSTSIRVGFENIIAINCSPRSRDLGVFIDPDLSM